MIKAMKQAFDALLFVGHTSRSDTAIAVCAEATDVLRQAIAQAEKQQALDKKADNARELGLDYEPEPVAYIDHVSGKPKFINGYVVQTSYDIPLYSAPPRKEWVGLTDEEVSLYDKRLSGSGVARDIEAKLRERNT